LFIRDPVNAAVLSFFTVTAVLVLATSMSLGGPIYPTAMVTVIVIAMAASLIALLPYFLYVFDFLTPTSIIYRIQYRSIRALRRATRPTTISERALKIEVKNSVEQLGDIALNSVEKREKAIAISALDSLAEIAEASLISFAHLSEEWFHTRDLSQSDRDFVALHPTMVEAFSDQKTWLEMKIFRQFQAVFVESVNLMRDCNHMVAIHTRNLAVQAAESNHHSALRLAIRYMNTYLRAAINARDVRTAYNLFNEYRALAEALMLAKQDTLAIQAAERFKFYGQLAFHSALSFILEVAAYDLCALLEKAYQIHSPCHGPMLSIFLDVDREPTGEKGQEASLRGVRKAQVKLATFYLVNEEEALARRIYEDMISEPRHRLQSIRDELKSITVQEYWEVSDRGINFDYLPEEQRAQLEKFFGWFSQLN